MEYPLANKANLDSNLPAAPGGRVNVAWQLDPTTGNTSGNVPAGASIALKVNGAANAVQTILNLISGGNITLTDNGTGGVIVAATVPSAIALKTGGVNNPSQSVLNLVAGSNISLTSGAGGLVTVAATGTITGANNFVSQNSSIEAASSTANNMKGFVLIPLVNMKLTGLQALMGAMASTVNAQFMIYQLTSVAAPTITSVIYTGTINAGIAGSGQGIFDNLSGSPIALAAGSVYALVVQMSNQVAAFVNPITTVNNNLWQCMGFSPVGNGIGHLVTSPTVNPAIGATLTLTATPAATYNLQLATQF